MAVLLRLVEVFNYRKDALVHQACPHDEYRHVGSVGDDACISDEVDRRTVEEDVVELASHLLDHGLEVIRKEKLGRVRRKSSYRKDEESRLDFIHVCLIVVRLAVEVCSHTAVLQSEGLAEGCLAEVEVHESHLCALEGHAGCYVHHGEGLTCARVE